MRKANGKKILVTVSCFILVLSFIAPSALAEPLVEVGEPSFQLDFQRIVLMKVDLTISASGLSTSYCRVRLANSSDSVTLAIELQRQNGNSWSRVNSWSTSGSGVVFIERDWNVARGNSYRVRATAQVFNSSGRLVETAVDHSAIVLF